MTGTVQTITVTVPFIKSNKHSLERGAALMGLVGEKRIPYRRYLTVKRNGEIVPLLTMKTWGWEWMCSPTYS